MRRGGSHIKGLLYHCKITRDPILSTKHQESAKMAEMANSQPENFRRFPESIKNIKIKRMSEKKRQ